MLTITPQASNAIRGALASSEAPEGSVFRISPEPGEGNLVLAIVESPEADDQIVAGDGVEICIEPITAQALHDKELDAQVVEGEVNFIISEQGAAAAGGGEGPNGLPDPDREGPAPE